MQREDVNTSASTRKALSSVCATLVIGFLLTEEVVTGVSISVGNKYCSSSFDLLTFFLT